MHEYETKCWSCGSEDMKNYGEYVQCRRCGATWNQVPHGGPGLITVEDIETGGSPRPYRDTHSRPSKAVQRQAARDRDARSKE